MHLKKPEPVYKPIPLRILFYLFLIGLTVFLKETEKPFSIPSFNIIPHSYQETKMDTPSTHSN